MACPSNIQSTTVGRHKTFQFGPRKIKTCEISIFSFPALDKSMCIAQYLHDPVGTLGYIGTIGGIHI